MQEMRNYNADTLKRLMEREGLKINSLSKETTLDRHTIRDIINAKSSMSNSSKEILCNYFNLPDNHFDTSGYIGGGNIIEFLENGFTYDDGKQKYYKEYIKRTESLNHACEVLDYYDISFDVKLHIDGELEKIMNVNCSNIAMITQSSGKMSIIRIEESTRNNQMQELYFWGDIIGVAISGDSSEKNYDFKSFTDKATNIINYIDGTLLM